MSIMRGLLCFAMLLSACAADDVLNKVCPIDCYTGPEDTLGVGVCRTGKTGCDENGDPTDECIGEVVPDPLIEECDGLDNNCNGEVDERWPGFQLTKWNTDDICRQGGVCRRPLAYCIRGEWKCDYPDTYEEVETTCDGLDNDCDYLVDEEIGNNELCFDDDFWKATNGECRPGVVRCVNGTMTCDGQTLPSSELCDRKDNDCDGEIDNNSTDDTPLDYDIVFIIDHSGSMCSYIDAVATACDAYIEQFENNSRFRFALVVMTANGGSRVQVEVPFGDIAAIRDKLSTLGCNGSGTEASLNSMYDVCDDTNPLALDWRLNAGRLFFAFTDENAQSYPSGISSQDVIDSCQNSWTLPFIWGNYQYDFQSICTSTNGLYFNLPSISATAEVAWNKIFDDMNSIVVTLCGS